jgi:hypothetical protein
MYEPLMGQRLIDILSVERMNVSLILFSMSIKHGGIFYRGILSQDWEKSLL